MTLLFSPLLGFLLGLFTALVPSVQDAGQQNESAQKERRIVILKVDGLNADLLYKTMRETDPASGKSRLP